MSKERMVQVTKEEYENLIRDQHTVELLTEYIRQDWQSDPMICLLLGVQGPENHPVMKLDLEKRFRKEEEPESVKATEVLREEAEVAVEKAVEGRLESPPLKGQKRKSQRRPVKEQR